MGINVEGFVMYVEQAVDTLACREMATISTKNIFVKLQPRRTRFQWKKRWILQLLLFFSTVIVEMIYMAILLHSFTEREPNRQAGFENQNGHQISYKVYSVGRSLLYDG